MPTPFPGSASQLGGPIGGPMPSQPLRIGGFYNNQFGTTVRGGIDPLQRGADFSAEFPVGDYRSGNYAGVNLGYNKDQGMSAQLKFGKKRAPRLAGQDVYNMGLEVNGPVDRFAGQRSPFPGMGQVEMPYGIPTNAGF